MYERKHPFPGLLINYDNDSNVANNYNDDSNSDNGDSVIGSVSREIFLQ